MTQALPYHFGGLVLLALRVITILVLSLRTIRAALRGKICQPE